MSKHISQHEPSSAAADGATRFSEGWPQEAAAFGNEPPTPRQPSGGRYLLVCGLILLGAGALVAGGVFVYQTFLADLPEHFSTAAKPQRERALGTEKTEPGQRGETQLGEGFTGKEKPGGDPPPPPDA